MKYFVLQSVISPTVPRPAVQLVDRVERGKGCQYIAGMATHDRGRGSLQGASWANCPKTRFDVGKNRSSPMLYVMEWAGMWGIEHLNDGRRCVQWRGLSWASLNPMQEIVNYRLERQNTMARDDEWSGTT